MKKTVRTNKGGWFSFGCNNADSVRGNVPLREQGEY